MKYLLVGGCPRSGTTAMVRLLNLHPKVVLGMERFGQLAGAVTPELFSASTFFRCSEAEARSWDESFYQSLREKWEQGGVRYFGDKYPRYVRRMRKLRASFPGCKFILMLRELAPVASSFNRRRARPADDWEADYRVAVEEWNASLRCTWDGLYEDAGNVYPVIYERIFSRAPGAVEALFAFLGLELDDEMRTRYLTMTRKWPDRRSAPLDLDERMIEHLRANADASLKERVWDAALTLEQRFARRAGAGVERQMG